MKDKLRSIGEGIREPVCFEAADHIEKLEQQLAERDAEIAKWKRAFENGGYETMQEQLAAKDTLLRNVYETLEYVQPWCNGQYNGHEKCQNLIFEAIAAIDKELKP